MHSFGQMSLSLSEESSDDRGVVVGKQRREQQCDNGPKELAQEEQEQHDRRVRLSSRRSRFRQLVLLLCSLQLRTSRK